MSVRQLGNFGVKALKKNSGTGNTCFKFKLMINKKKGFIFDPYVYVGIVQRGSNLVRQNTYTINATHILIYLLHPILERLIIIISYSYYHSTC